MSTPPSDQSEAGTVHRRLSVELEDLLRIADGRVLSIGELEAILQGRGFALFILLLSIPFLCPVAIPGLSIPFGIVVMLLGIRIATGQKPSLPSFIVRRQISPAVLEKMVTFGLKICSRMERVVKPRMQFMQRSPGMLHLIGVGIASGGLQLLLPLPPLIPFSNFIPAVSVVLLTAGLTERDGLMVLAGYAVNVIAWIYFGVMFSMAGEGIQWLVSHWPW